MSLITEGAALNARFVAAANEGGNWVKYEYQEPGQAKETRTTYVSKLFKYGKLFYLGVGFVDAPAPKEADCTASYAEPCA